jgi:hypothetical protein
MDSGSSACTHSVRLEPRSVPSPRRCEPTLHSGELCECEALLSATADHRNRVICVSPDHARPFEVDHAVPRIGDVGVGERERANRSPVREQRCRTGHDLHLRRTYRGQCLPPAEQRKRAAQATYQREIRTPRSAFLSRPSTNWRCLLRDVVALAAQ